MFEMIYLSCNIVHFQYQVKQDHPNGSLGFFVSSILIRGGYDVAALCKPHFSGPVTSSAIASPQTPVGVSSMGYADVSE